MKIRTLAFVFALPLLLPAAEAPKLSAVDQQAIALESQLNKSLDSSAAAAKVMLELVGLYYKEGRVFGLVRVGERFAKAQSRHPEHRAVMLKLLDGLEVMSRRNDFITIGRQYLSRYPDSAEALDVALRLSDALERNRKRAEAADALRLLWEHKPVAARRKAAERASELYGQEGNHRLRIRSAQLAESLMEKLPASPYTVRCGFRAVHEYRHLSRWAEATQVAMKMFKKRLPLSRVMQHELHRLTAASYASQSQWANADASLRKARALRDSPRMAADQITYMYNAGLKAQQIETELRGFAGKFPKERARWEATYYLGHAYARESNPQQAARAVGTALPHAASSHSIATYYVQWMVDTANNARGAASNVQLTAEKNLAAAKADETTKRTALAKATDPKAKQAAQTALTLATALVRKRVQELQQSQTEVRAREQAFQKQVAAADRALTAALKPTQLASREHDGLALRYALSRTLYHERAKDDAKALAHAREAVKEVHFHNSSLQTLVYDLLSRQTDGGQFRNDVAQLLTQRRNHLSVSYYRDYVGNWVSAVKSNKEHKAKARFVTDALAKQNREPLVQAVLRYPRPQDNVKAAIPLRAQALNQFSNLSRRNQFYLVDTQRYALVHYARKRDPALAKQISLALLQKYPKDHDAAAGLLWLYLNSTDKTDAKKYTQQFLRLSPMTERVNTEFLRNLMKAAELNEDAALANQVYQWAIRGRVRPTYSDYFGDVLWKLGQKNQALDWWKRVVEAPSEGRAEERNCAERFLTNGGKASAAVREQIEFRWPELAIRVAAHRATDELRKQGNADAFARAVAQLEKQSADLPFINEDWLGFVDTWRAYAINNASYIGTDNSAYKDFKPLDDAAKLKVYIAVRDLRARDYSAWATCDHLLAGGADHEPPVARLLRLLRVTRDTHNDHSRWNTLRSYAQKAFEQERYVESATLLTGALAHLTNVPKTAKDEGRGAVLRAHSRMGAVGLTIDENSPMAPLLSAALYLRLGDREKALELYQENAALFAAHRNDLPPDLMEFVCNHLMTGGDEARLAVVEDFLRGWLIKFTDPDKPESKQQSEDAKARLQLLLAKSYYKGQRYDVARAEYSTVTNRYAGTPHAIEAKFGIGESFMAQKIYDKAAQAFKALEDNPNQTVSIRAEFLTGLLAFRQEQHDAAREKFQHILERVPDVELANRTLFSLSEIYGLEQRYLQQLNLLRTVGRLGHRSKRLHVPGTALSIVVHDRDLGVSRGKNRIPVVVTTHPGGDKELVYLRSTAGAGKGLFRGEVDTALGTVAQGDGVLQLTGNDVIASDYPPEFKAQFRTVPLSDVEIRVAADGEFSVASSEIVDAKEETLTQQLEREQMEANADRRVSQGRPTQEVKPGNRIFLRIKDRDRDLGDSLDKLTVTLRADSGDQVQVDLVETGPHTGEFRAAIPTAELPAGAAATDSAIGHNPLMAIDHSRETFWQSEPDGLTPKLLTVDMKQLHTVSRVRVNTPHVSENAPVRGRLLGSHDGVFWFTIAAHPPLPAAQPVSEKTGAMQQRIFAGDYTGYKTWAQVSQLGRTGTPKLNEPAARLAWSVPNGEADANQPHAAIWHGQLVQRREGAMRIAVTGDLVAIAVNGKVQLAPSAEKKSVDVWLKQGVHEVVVFSATKQAERGLAVTRARANVSSSQPQLKPFTAEDFDVAGARKFLGENHAPAPPKVQPVAMNYEQVEFRKITEKFGVTTVNNLERIGYWQNAADWMKWVFDAPRAGTYELWMQSSHANGGSKFRVEFGDQLIEGTVLKTGDWNRFAWQRVGLVQLEAAGVQILSIKPVEIAGGGLMDLAKLELRPVVGAGVIQRDREWEFFFDPVELRFARLQVDEYLGDSVAINHVEIRSTEQTFIPTKVDVSTLAQNASLEIAGGDVVTASYTDDIAVATQGGSRLLTQQLQATYNDARVVPIGFNFSRNGAGTVQQTRKELLRIDPGDRITFEVVDYDMDQTDERDTVPVEVWLNGAKWKDLIATETEEYSGIFRVEVDTAAAAAEGKLVIQKGDRVFCRYADLQNTFPGHSVDREGVVFANEPTEGVIRLIGTRRTQPPAESEAPSRPIYLPTPEHIAEPVEVNFFVPLTVEVIDPDAAKDSLSTVNVLLNAGTTNAVEVTCVLSTQFGDFSDLDPGAAHPALRMGRFVGQVKMQLGGEGSPMKLPRALGANAGVIGRARPAGAAEDAGDDNLLDTVLNVNGQAVLQATYQDVVRPNNTPTELAHEARLSTDGAVEITDDGYDKATELLHVGEKLFVRVQDPDLDITDERDTATVIISSESGEKESVKLQETLSHSGVFTGSFELKAREKPTAANFSDIDKEIECFFGDQLTVAYTDTAAGVEAGEAALSLAVPVAIGTDGIVTAFSKIFGNQQLAVQTQFHIAESYFELFKNNLKLERPEESDKALKAGRRVLMEIMVDYPNPKYLPRIAYLSGQFSQELKDWNEAANSYILIVRQHPNHTLAADAQYKLAQCYEEAEDFDRALEEYVTLAATYPKSPLIPNVMIRINEYFYKRENFKIAAKVAEKFMDRFGDHAFAPKMCFRWGQCYYKNEAFAKAGGVFDLFVKKFPDDGLSAQSIFWAGESYRSANNVPFAFRRYNRCRWDFPESEAAKYARGRLALPEMLAQFEAEANSIDNDN